MPRITRIKILLFLIRVIRGIFPSNLFLAGLASQTTSKRCSAGCFLVPKQRKLLRLREECLVEPTATL